MILLIDVGNTRTKWALATNTNSDSGNDTSLGAIAEAEELSHIDVCMNSELALSTLQKTAKKANKVVVANVASEKMAQHLLQMLLPLDIHFIKPSFKACGVTNSYNQPEKLGADRFAALIAAWHLSHQFTIVVSAGTAITIDVLSDQGVFLGGTIMPGLRLMRAALHNNTANLNLDIGEYVSFPINTKNAIETGCLNAAIGAIGILIDQIQALQSKKVQLILTGGDASKLLDPIKQLEKKGIIAPYFAPRLIPNLVLQGLLLLERERA